MMYALGNIRKRVKEGFMQVTYKQTKKRVRTKKNSYAFLIRTFAFYNNVFSEDS